MNVDTGTFRAIQARAEAVDALRGEVSSLSEQARVIADALLSAKWLIEVGRSLEREEIAPPRSVPRRHVRPRADRPAWLRGVVNGGAR